MRKYFIKHGTKEGPKYESKVSHLTLSVDGSSVAYGYQSNDGWVIRHDDKISPSYSETRDIALSKDGFHLAYLAKKANGVAVANLDGVDGPEYETVTDLCLSADGLNIMYRAVKENGREVVSHNGVEGSEYSIIINPVLSSDGLNIAYFAYDEDRSNTFLVINGKEIAKPKNVVDMKIISDDPVRVVLHAKEDSVIEKYTYVLAREDKTQKKSLPKKRKF